MVTLSLATFSSGESDLQKRALDVEQMIKKADAKRWPNPNDPLPDIDSSTRASVNKWADRAMQASGLDNVGLREQVMYYRDKASKAKKRGDAQRAKRAKEKGAEWEKAMLHSGEAGVDLIASMRERAQSKIARHQQALQALEQSSDLHPDSKEYRIERGAKKVRKWQGKHEDLTNLNDAKAVKASEWADLYHFRRLVAMQNEESYRKMAQSQSEPYRWLEKAELANDHRIDKERATQKWLQWRAVARAQQRRAAFTPREM
jgi:hypothetical protein